MGGPSESSSGFARNFSTEYTLTDATTAKIMRQVAFTNQKTKSYSSACSDPWSGSHGTKIAIAVVTAPTTIPIRTTRRTAALRTVRRDYPLASVRIDPFRSTGRCRRITGRARDPGSGHRKRRPGSVGLYSFRSTGRCRRITGRARDPGSGHRKRRPRRRRHGRSRSLGAQVQAPRYITAWNGYLAGNKRPMGLGASLFLIAVGAILTWAVTAEASGIDIQVVGVILMIVGLIGFVLSILFWSTWGGPAYFGGRRRTNADGEPPPPGPPPP